MKNGRFEIPNSSLGFFLSSSGGHFSELNYIAKRFNACEGSLLITFESSDTKNHISEFEIHYLPYVKPRKFFPLLKLFYLSFYF